MCSALALRKHSQTHTGRTHTHTGAPQSINFNPYTKEQIAAIIQNRLDAIAATKDV